MSGNPQGTAFDALGNLFAVLGARTGALIFVAQLDPTTGAYAREQQLQARADAENFLKRLDQYHKLRQQNPDYLAGIWWDEMSRLFTRMRQNGRLDLLDHHLGANGLDITQVPLMPKKK